MTATTPPSSPTVPVPEPAASLIEYPSAFPIKVMGLHQADFVPTMVALARQFDPDFEASHVEVRTSSGGKYLGLTLTVTATSRQQLDDLYRCLSAHPMVKMVL